MAMAQPPLGGSGGSSETFHHPPPHPCGIPPPPMPLSLDPTRPGGPPHPAGPGSFSPSVPHAPSSLGNQAPPHGGVATDGAPVPYHAIPGHFNGGHNGHPLSHPPTAGPPLSAGGFSGAVPPPPPPHPLLGSGQALHQQPQQGAVPPSGLAHHGLSVPPVGSDATPGPPMMGGPPPPQQPPLAGAAALNGTGAQAPSLSHPATSTSVRHAENMGTQPASTTMTNATNGTTASTLPVAIPPNRTLYVNNLNSKIKLDQLKRDLRSMFENFGVVRDIIAMSSFWRRGQAWVIFADQESADRALTQLQGFPYANKEMRIQYAREVSDIFTKEEGTFVTRPPGPKKPRAIIEREKKLQAQLQQFQQMMLQHMQQQAATNAGNPPTTNPSMSQSLQAASAIAAQVQQAIQPVFGGTGATAGLLGQQRVPQQPGSGPTGALAGQFVAAGGNPPSGGPAKGPGRMPLHHGFAQPTMGGPGSISHPDGAGAMAFGHAGLIQQHGGPPSCMPGMGRGHPMGSAAGGAGHPDMKAVPPPAPMSKDAVVAAAAAAAAAAVGAAAKKRAMGAGQGAASNQPPPPAVPNPGMMGAFNPLSNFGGPSSSAGHQDKSHPSHNNNATEVPHPSGVPSSGPSTANEAAAVAASLAGGAPGRAPLLHNPSLGLGMEESDFGGPAVPNRTLCVENLPENCNTKMLEMVFRQYAGCGDIRHIASRRVAFVDYETVAQSSLALRYLNNFPITENHPIRVSFARH